MNTTPIESLPATSTSTHREQRLTRYCAAGAAAVAAISGAVTTADASIVFVDYNNTIVPDAAPGDSFFSTYAFDLDSNGTFDFRLGVRSGDTNGGGAIFLIPPGGSVGVMGIAEGDYNYVARLAAGTVIGPDSPFLTLAGSGFAARASMASGNGFPNSQWAAPSPATGYLGIRFTGADSTMQYAWLNLSVAGNTNPGAREITLIGAAYETSGQAITAGAVPEPGSLALVALGAAGFIAYRRRKTAAATAATAPQS